MQETKLTDADAPVMSFGMAGYQLVHHGEGRWNGVAIAARAGLDVSDVVTNFGDGPVRDSGPGGSGAEVTGEDDFDPFDEARMVAATVAGLRVVSLYAPNGRVVDSPFYAGKLAWFERLARWVRETTSPGDAVVLGGDLNVAPTDADVWDAAAVHGGTHVSERERAAFRALLDAGLSDAYRSRHDETGRFSWWDYRAGMFHKNLRDAHRPPPGVAVCGCAGRRCRDRPRGTQGPAHPIRPRSIAHRPRRAGPPDRPRLGGRPGPYQGTDQATASLSEVADRPGRRRVPVRHAFAMSERDRPSNPTDPVRLDGRARSEYRKSVPGRKVRGRELRMAAPDGVGEGRDRAPERAHLKVRERGAQAPTRASAIPRHAELTAPPSKRGLLGGSSLSSHPGHARSGTLRTNPRSRPRRRDRAGQARLNGCRPAQR